MIQTHTHRGRDTQTARSVGRHADTQGQPTGSVLVGVEYGLWTQTAAGAQSNAAQGNTLAAAAADTAAAAGSHALAAAAHTRQALPLGRCRDLYPRTRECKNEVW